MAHPWEIGDSQQRWRGYLDEDHFDPMAGGYVLRNKVGATTFWDLRTAEDDAVALRVTQLRRLGIPHSYDLEGLREIHGHLFQDIYEWAGDVRTVGIGKGEGAFAKPDEIPAFMQVAAELIVDTDALRSVPEEQYPNAIAVVYATINSAHPFREGNGRTQREFLTALARESDRDIHWGMLNRWQNTHASEEARKHNLEPMVEMMRDLVRRDPTVENVAPVEPTQRAETQRARVSVLRGRAAVPAGGSQRAAGKSVRGEAYDSPRETPGYQR